MKVNNRIIYLSNANNPYWFVAKPDAVIKCKKIMNSIQTTQDLSKYLRTSRKHKKLKRKMKNKTTSFTYLKVTHFDITDDINEENNAHIVETRYGNAYKKIADKNNNG